MRSPRIAVAVIALGLLMTTALLVGRKTPIPEPLTTTAPASASPAEASMNAPNATASAAPAPSSSFGMEPPGVLLDLRLGTDPNAPGASLLPCYPNVNACTIPGGSTRGPTSIAISEDGRVYLWDQANGRVLVYASSQLDRVIPVAVPHDARELEVLNGKLYFASNALGARLEWELNAASGTILRTGPPTAGRQSTLYPTLRWTPATSAVNGAWPIGVDRYGDRYERFIDGVCSRGTAVCLEVRRRTATGTLLATAAEPAGIAVEDYYVARDGAVYELRTDLDLDRRAVGVFVIRLLSAPPVPHKMVGLAGQVRDYDRMRQDGVMRPGDPPLIPNDGNPPGAALVGDAVVRLEQYGLEARTDAEGKLSFPAVDVPAPCRWVTVSVTKPGFGSYRTEFALYSPDVHIGLQLWIERRDVDNHLGPPQAAANLGEAYCLR